MKALILCFRPVLQHNSFHMPPREHKATFGCLQFWSEAAFINVSVQTGNNWFVFFFRIDLCL